MTRQNTPQRTRHDGLAQQVRYLKGPLDMPFRFNAVPPFAGTLRSICVQHDHEVVLAVEFVFRVSTGTFRLMEAHSFLGLHAASRGPSLAGRWAEELPVDVELFLKPAVFRPWFPHGVQRLREDTKRLLADLENGGSGALAREDAYTYLGVTQQPEGQVFAVGFRNQRYAPPGSHFVR